MKLNILILIFSASLNICANNLQDQVFQVDLMKQRYCTTIEFIRGPYLPGPVADGAKVSNESNETISLQEIIDDEFIYFDIGVNTDELFLMFVPIMFGDTVEKQKSFLKLRIVYLLVVTVQ